MTNVIIKKNISVSDSGPGSMNIVRAMQVKRMGVMAPQLCWRGYIL